MATAKIQLKGLSALSNLSRDFDEHADDKEFDSLPLDSIYSVKQPRLVFKKIEELAESMKEIGQQQPIVVNPDGHGKYVIEQGERRFRAAQLAGFTRIYAVINSVKGDKTPADRKVRQLAENLQRDEMKLYEVAKTIGEIVASGLAQNELAHRLGKKESYISALMAVSDPPEVLDKFASELHIQDPVSLRRLKNLYAKNPKVVEDQIEAWSNELDDDGKPNPDYVVTRAQVNAFVKRVEDANSHIATKPVDAPVADDNPSFAPMATGGSRGADDSYPVEEEESEEASPKAEKPKKEKASVGEEPSEEPEVAEEECPETPDLLEGCCSEQPARILVSVKYDGREGFLTPCVVPPAGKLCITLGQNEKPLLVEVGDVQILGVVAKQ